MSSRTQTSAIGARRKTIGHTDNKSVTEKVELRRIATRHLESLKVLDCFAGEVVIWGHFDCDRYYGIEAVKGKGKNLYADNRKVIPSLDLSGFNVIDLDSYGCPFEQFQLCFDNETLQNGTVFCYTITSSPISNMSAKLARLKGIQGMIRDCPTLFNQFTIDYLYDFLYESGVREVHEYRHIEGDKFSRIYGYFTYNG